MTLANYYQFCPIAMACEVIEPRWTLLILCEMWSGSNRFNEIRRGVPRMSPTFLSKRLKEMEHKGLVRRLVDPDTSSITYTTTPLAEELQPIVQALGEWAHKNIDSQLSLENLDVKLLMWNVRRKINLSELPPRKIVMQFIYPELPEDQRNYWLVAKPKQDVDLCWQDPGFDVDLYITADLRAMTSAWMGWSDLHSEIANDAISLEGDGEIASTISSWMVRSLFSTT